MNNLTSSFDKFIQNEWVEAPEMHLLKIKNKQKNYAQEQFGNEFSNNQEEENYYNDYIKNNVEFSSNWFDCF